MRLHLIAPLLEGFKEKKAAFIAAGADAAAVDAAISQFKALKSRGLLQGDEADIDRYENFEQLQQATQAASQKTTATQQKKKARAEGADVVLDNDEVTILVPHTYEAAKLYGKGTRWCISSEDYPGHFADYRRRLAKHYMFLFKNRQPYSAKARTGDVDYKMALTVYPARELDFRDSADESMSQEDWKRRSGFDAAKFKPWHYQEMPPHEMWKVALRAGMSFKDFVLGTTPEQWGAIGKRAVNLKRNWFTSQRAKAEKEGKPAPSDEQLEADWTDFWRIAKADMEKYHDDPEFVDTLKYYMELIESRPGSWLANALLEGTFKIGDARAWFLAHPPGSRAELELQAQTAQARGDGSWNDAEGNMVTREIGNPQAQPHRLRDEPGQQG